MSSKNFEVTKAMLKHCPSLVRSEETVHQLVMRGFLDMHTGMESIDILKSLEDGDQVGHEAEPATEAEPSDGLKFPDIHAAVVIKTTMELASGDEKEAFNRKLDELNLTFQTAFKRRKADIIRLVKEVVEIDGAVNDEAVAIAKAIKDDQIVVIKR